ncbi:MAG: hypothetical protein ACHBN1_25960 [Heteroscytonema crispum UTEX LB 1556]
MTALLPKDALSTTNTGRGTLWEEDFPIACVMSSSAGVKDHNAEYRLMANTASKVDVRLDMLKTVKKFIV